MGGWARATLLVSLLFATNAHADEWDSMIRETKREERKSKKPPVDVDEWNALRRKHMFQLGLDTRVGTFAGDAGGQAFLLLVPTFSFVLPAGSVGQLKLSAAFTLAPHSARLYRYDYVNNGYSDYRGSGLAGPEIAVAFDFRIPGNAFYFGPVVRTGVLMLQTDFTCYQSYYSTRKCTYPSGSEFLTFPSIGGAFEFGARINERFDIGGSFGASAVSGWGVEIIPITLHLAYVF